MQFSDTGVDINEPQLLAIENEIQQLRLNGLSDENDIRLWKGAENEFKPVFISRQTWHVTQQQTLKVDWYRGLWFSGATPKYSVIAWITVHNRLYRRSNS